MVMEGILGGPVDLNTSQRINGEILTIVVLRGIHKEVVPFAWQSPQTDEKRGRHLSCM